MLADDLHFSVKQASAPVCETICTFSHQGKESLIDCCSYSE